MKNLADKRREYTGNGIDFGNIPATPFQLFELWYTQIEQTGFEDANAMVLSTTDGREISSRVVLLKSFDDAGFVFYTNYASRKGKQIEEVNRVSLLFFWTALMRQVRIEGNACRTSENESDLYFESRPVGSRAGAIVSSQSQICSFDYDISALAEELVKSSKELKRPSNWGGYRVIPDRVEFWQGKENRIHDRIEYKLENGKWAVVRLQP